MIIQLHVTDEPRIDAIRYWIEARGGRTTRFGGDPAHAAIACTGLSAELAGTLARMDGVRSVAPSRHAWVLGTRALAPSGSVVRAGDHPATWFGGSEIPVIAGPCAVEDATTFLDVARTVRASGARLLRGGIWKPRTSPYAFQGLGETGLDTLRAARRATGLPVVTEVMDPRCVDVAAAAADVLQVGARSMQNFPLLAELGRAQRPVLLKRGAAATIEELLCAAEYILSHGNQAVILCERGIRTFETATRNTLDTGAIALLKQETHLPVIADPSHAAGRRDLVEALALAAVAAGADGLLVEVHPHPESARSDGAQSLSPAGFARMMERLRPVAAAVGRRVAGSGENAPEVAA